MPETTDDRTREMDHLPTLHLNGSGLDNLLEQRRDVLHALRDLQDALAHARPHGRDYYVNPDPDALNKARAVHEARTAQVQDMVDEINAEVRGLLRQDAERRRHR